MSPTATKDLGVIKIIRALSIVLGIFTQLVELLLMWVMVGAIQKKVFVWNTEFL